MKNNLYYFHYKPIVGLYYFGARFILHNIKIRDRPSMWLRVVVIRTRYGQRGDIITTRRLMINDELT